MNNIWNRNENFTSTRSTTTQNNGSLTKSNPLPTASTTTTYSHNNRPFTNLYENDDTTDSIFISRTKKSIVGGGEIPSKMENPELYEDDINDILGLKKRSHHRKSKSHVDNILEE